jgi:hypothetical protein
MQRLNVMKSVRISLLCFGVFFFSCEEGEKSLSSDLTGNETVFSLVQGSQYDINGNITFKEKKDGSTQVEVSLRGTSGEIYHPVHLHVGDISLVDADLAAQLNPVYGKTGTSSTNLKMLADESMITYNDLKSFAGSIKIHLAAAGPERDIILAAGNIGTLSSGTSGGRLSIATCKSE